MKLSKFVIINTKHKTRDNFLIGYTEGDEKVKEISYERNLSEHQKSKVKRLCYNNCCSYDVLKCFRKFDNEEFEVLKD